MHDVNIISVWLHCFCWKDNYQSACLLIGARKCKSRISYFRIHIFTFLWCKFGIIIILLSNHLLLNIFLWLILVLTAHVQWHHFWSASKYFDTHAISSDAWWENTKLLTIYQVPLQISCWEDIAAQEDYVVFKKCDSLLTWKNKPC